MSASGSTLLAEVTADELVGAGLAVLSARVQAEAARIVAAVEAGGREAVLELRARHDGRGPEEALVLEGAALHEAARTVAPEDRALLERAAARIERFATAQRLSATDVELAIEGGRAGHHLLPVRAAGCYAPAGRHPLPSSVLMGAVTARCAGVERVVVATPSADPLMLAAAAIAGADAVLLAGGAHAVAALAYGFEDFPAVDVVVGPGNAWVTAAKQRVFGRVGIDGLAGPSELVTLADGSADPRLVAADLVAQAEHDPDARTVLLTTSRALLREAQNALAEALEAIPRTAAVARQALSAGASCFVETLEEGRKLCDALAPEHVQLMYAGASPRDVRRAGAVFVGRAGAEVFGDYAAGPNHCLPTGGCARHSSGLSVFDFLRRQTYLEIEDAPELAADAAALARLEGLDGHRRAAELRTRP